MAAWIAATASVLVAVIAGVLTYVNSRRLSARQARLDRVNSQLEEFYGPLYALSEAGGSAWKAFRAKHRPGGAYFDGGESEEDRVEWVRWMSSVFMPINRRMYEIVVTKTHLLDDVDLPPCLLDFCAHVAGYEAVVRQWELGDTSSPTSLLNHPGEPLRVYLKTSYLRIKDQQQKLLGA
ncbi:hypothetical protein ACFQV2_38010 [Actinokineospora soli]|uniref:DUF4760 domain-containing protein n=1 Tax=Actinokineospora soli TaxID=1048753 RepID=A0ABW2TWZ1_9PSEU